MIAGNYTYTVSAAPCPDATATVTVSLITPPFSGIPNPASICENATPKSVPPILAQLWTQQMSNRIQLDRDASKRLQIWWTFFFVFDTN